MVPGKQPSTRAGWTPGSGGGYTWQVTVPAAERMDLVLMEHVGNLEVKELTSGAALLRGELPDLPAVYGLVLRLRDAATLLLSLHVERRPSEQHDEAAAKGDERREGGRA